MHNLRFIGVLSITLFAIIGVPAAIATPPEAQTLPPPTDTTPPPAPPESPPAPPESPPETPPPPVTTVIEAPPIAGSEEGVEGATAEKPQEPAPAASVASIETLPLTGAAVLVLVGFAVCLIGAGFAIRRSGQARR